MGHSTKTNISSSWRSASRPPIRTTTAPLMPSACVCGDAPVSEAGKLTTRRQCFASLADSVSAWAECEVRFEAAGRKIALVMQLAGVGHPFVDQDQGRA